MLSIRFNYKSVSKSSEIGLSLPMFVTAIGSYTISHSAKAGAISRRKHLDWPSEMSVNVLKNQIERINN